MKMAERIKLGRTGMEVSPICFGCWQMGGTFWGPAGFEVLTEAVHRALDVGVNFFDTADAYGDGLSEEILGRALASVRRDEVIIATKVHENWQGKRGGPRIGDLSHDYILWECEQSLKRLGIETIDLYQAHSFDVFTPLDETVRAFDKLKKQGKIRYYGTSNFSVEQLRAAVAVGDFDTVQPKYSLMVRQIEKDILPFCVANDLGVLAYSPLHHGLLTGKFTGTETFDDWRSGVADFQGQAFKDNAARAATVKGMADSISKTAAQMALRFVLDHPAVHCAIAGIKTAQQIEDAAGAMGWGLSRPEYYGIRKAFDA